MAQPLLSALPVARVDAPPTLAEAIVAWVRTLTHRRALWITQTKSGADHLGADFPRELAGILCDDDDPQQEAEFCARDERARSLTARAAELRTLSLEMDDGRLASMQSALGLTDSELDLVAMCVAAELEPRLVNALSFTSSKHRIARLTLQAAARLCGRGRVELATPSGALRQWGPVGFDEPDPGEAATLRVDPFIVGFVHGYRELDPQLLPVAEVISPRAPLDDWPIESVVQGVADALSRGLPSRIHVLGSPRSGRKTFGAVVAGRLGAGLVAVDLGTVASHDWHDVIRRARRQALLHGQAIAWCRVGERPLDDIPAKTPLEFIVVEHHNEVEPRCGWHEQSVELPRLTAAARANLWRKLLPEFRTWDPREQADAAERIAINVGEIVHIAEQSPTGLDEVLLRARQLTRGRLGELGRLLDCPFSRGDLCLPRRIDEQLDDFLFEARERNRFWEDETARRLFPRGTGLMALLSGAPGTGKTMAAQVVAAELGIDLFRIDLASMVSKYIGETSKNLRRLFTCAKDMNAMLLFDEADALFTKRTEVRDAHDRHSNADTNYLLQLIEEYPGIALLATNRRQNMDEAFVRRIRYSLHFPKPDAEQRREIWRRLVQSLAKVEIGSELSEELDGLAAAVDATGAQIKNAVLGAAFISRRASQPMSIEHLHAALARELGNGGVELPQLQRRASSKRQRGRR